MNNIKDIRKALFATGDGWSVLIWFLIYSVFFYKSAQFSEINIHHLKYLFFSIVALLIFVRFRVSSFDDETKTNIWGLVNVNGFGLIVLFKELVYG